MFFYTYGHFDEEGYPTSEDFFSNENSLQYLKNFNNDLHTNFNFYEISNQFVEHIGYYHGDNKFCDDSINQEVIDEMGNSMYVTRIKALRLGKNMCLTFKNNILEGRNFVESDYSITGPEEEVSAILGSDYQGIYQVGDVIETSLLNKSVKLKVIGFFKPNTAYLKKELLFQELPSKNSLDQLIVMPYYDILYEPTDEADALYQKRYYTQRNSGYIKVEDGLNCDKYIQQAKELTSLTQEEGFSYTCPPEYIYYKNMVEAVASKENVPYSISFSAIELTFPDK